MKTETVHCLNCNQSFLKNVYEIKRYSHHFCSKACNIQYRKINLKQTEIACNQCHTRFNIRNSELKKSKLHFCSHTCSAKFSNPKRKQISLCKCGNRKLKTSQLCNECNLKSKKNNTNDLPISSLYHKTSAYAAVKYNRLRKHARETLCRFNVPKKCFICGFDIHVEVCHIKSISSFPDDTKVSVVNSFDNLVYLCPNHHWMFDNKLVEINAPNQVRTGASSDRQSDVLAN